MGRPARNERQWTRKSGTTSIIVRIVVSQCMATESEGEAGHADNHPRSRRPSEALVWKTDRNQRSEVTAGSAVRLLSNNANPSPFPPLTPHPIRRTKKQPGESRGIQITRVCAR